MADENAPNWFADGLRFECTQCGHCCTGEPGYVWVTLDEIAALAAKVGMDVATFTEQNVKVVGRRRTLRERANGDCVLYNAAVGCVAYEVRPRQCRTWPFWKRNLATPADWKATCDFCPGAGTGPLFTEEEIVRQSEVIRV